MSRLIDADLLIKTIGDNTLEKCSYCDKEICDFQNCVEEWINNQPTAFDKEKVLVELEKYAHTFDYGEKGCDNALVVYKCRNIVREGGVE